jgi:hypothetical protein
MGDTEYDTPSILEFSDSHSASRHTASSESLDHPNPIRHPDSISKLSSRLLMRSLKRTGKSIPLLRSFVQEIDPSQDPASRCATRASKIWLKEKNGRRWEQRDRDAVLNELRKLR